MADNKNKQMKNILILTDFSDNALNACHYAVQLFEHDEVTFHLSHIKKTRQYISEDLMRLGSSDSLYDALIKSEKQKLKDLKNNLEFTYNHHHHNYSHSVDYDTFTDAIKQNIALNHIDLVVMGSNGISNSSESIFGSNTIQVLRDIQIPTLVIPEGYDFNTWQEILIPIEAGVSINIGALGTVLKTLKPFTSKIHVLHLYHENKGEIPNNHMELKFKEMFKGNPLEYHKVKNIPMHFSVNNYIQTHAIDVIVLNIKSESFFKRLFFGSETSKLANRPQAPLLAIHD